MKKFFAVFLSIILLASCTPPSYVTKTPPPTSAITPSLTRTVTPMPTRTVTPMPTNTIMPSATPVSPETRAQILHEQGSSALEISRVLKEEYSDLTQLSIAEILHHENFTGIEMGDMLRNLFELDASGSAQVLKNSGFTATDIWLMLCDSNGFNLKRNESASLLLIEGFKPIEITEVLRDTDKLSAYEAGLFLKELGRSEYEIQSLLIEAYDTYAVIVDIKTNTNKNTDQASAPEGFTGLGECFAGGQVCTDPYIPGLFGQYVHPVDINRGIGGDGRHVYVKYELVSKTSDTPVVTGIKAAHWPKWNVSCPEGWISVDMLTTKTKDSCYRVGMCARYEPFKDAKTFITNATISYGKWGNPASKCPAVCGANANIWPLYTDSFDIHKGCNDETWVYFCNSQAQPWPARPITIEVDDNEKLALLEQYAPRVFIHPSESFYPSSVEWSFDHLFRYSPKELPERYVIPYEYTKLSLGEIPLPPHLFTGQDDRYYVAPKEVILNPSDILEYHHGCNGSATANPCTLSDAPAYAFWHKQQITVGGESIEVADLTYFFYFPYNRGKEYYNTIWGNHVGDWEHITVRLSWVYNASAGWEIKPIHLFTSAHDFGTSHPWDTIATVPGSSHPIVYSALGGHGLYITAGRQRYAKISIKVYQFELNDSTGEGAKWDTWTNLKTFDYDTSLGLGSSQWPSWMDKDKVYTAPCAPDKSGCDPHDPASGPIYRWGLHEFGTCEILGNDTDCRMSMGPTSPADKGIWLNPYDP